MQVGWLTVAGLVADIVGFGMLAWDLLPEFRIYRLRNENKSLHEPTQSLISSLVHYRRKPEDAIAALAVDMAHLMPINVLRRNMGLQYTDYKKTTGQPASFLAESEREVAEAIDREADKLSNRWRPLIRIGILLVMLGFGLQLVGQLISMRLF